MNKITKFFEPLNYRKSLGARVFCLFTALIVIVYLSFIAFFINYQSNTLKQTLINKGKSCADHLAYSSRLGVFAENEELLKDPVEGIMQDREVLMVQIFTADGKQLKKHARQTGMDIGTMENIFDILNRSGSPVYYEGTDMIEFWAPVISNGSYPSEQALFFEKDPSYKKEAITGFVRIIFTTELLDKNINGLLLKSILIPIFFLIPGWIVIYYMVRGITRPLEDLTKGIRTIGTGGEFKKISSGRRTDEIGRLAKAFNHLAESLKEKETEKQQLEEQLRHAQKMEAIGTLAGGIAHDFNNILTGITGFAQLLNNTLGKEDPLKHHVRQILQSARKGAALTQSLLAFSRKQILTPAPVGINRIITGITKLLKRLIGEHIELKVDLQEDDLTIMADSGQIEQVMLNFATNARDAMPEGGCLEITTRSAGRNSLPSKDTDQDGTGRYAVISFTDTGQGIDKKERERIFDPFFTTKEPGEGTGLGLSIAYGIIKQHKGYINVTSTPGKGTTFDIYLPLINSKALEERTDSLPEPRTGTETILVAEDDESVMMFIASILEQYGYSTIQARDGKEAVKKFSDSRQKIDLLLLDVIMPKMNGQKVCNEVRKIQPAVKSLFISGYTADLMHKKKILEEGIHFIPKPVSSYDLLTKVREVLDG